jgi:hypothetical protein
VLLGLFMIGYIVSTTNRLLAAGLAACGKIAMSITMGYLLML